MVERNVWNLARNIHKVEFDGDVIEVGQRGHDGIKMSRHQVLLKKIKRLGPENHGVNYAETSERHHRRIEQLIIAHERCPENLAEAFGHDRPGRRLDPIAFTVVANELESEDKVVDGPKFPSGAVRSGADRAADGLPVAGT